MNPILRVLGLGLLESIASRLSPLAATVVQFTLIIGGSLLPIIPLLTGAIHLADLLAYTVLGMALSIAGTLIRLRTMKKRSKATTFLMLHYSIMIGILCLVCGVWAVILLVHAGPSGGWIGLLPMAIALVLAHGWSLADGWFTRGGRYVVTEGQVVLPGYLRFAPLLFATVLGASAYLGDGSEWQLVAIAVGLVLAQTVIDLGMALWAVKLHSRVAA
ncbi:DUF6498-containing protein [Knoellia subterranea]|uniref:Uncharacterized protein n=1 Tax=Knoellia subterranea KCTC 19937 TaxID=1385521 RepID=A0A0A0JJU8_9MICO|nr:DUF6498-containing protein [Knoellia subterranea]KGN36332.1 hypothetical protein N803_05880 [Knoellia subterranea KCTC 19937]